MNKLYLLLSFCIVFGYNSLGQSSDGGDLKNTKPNFERWQLGGEIALNFGTITYINLSPRVGYRFTEKFTVGSGIIYNYLKDSRFDGFEFSTYGGLLYANYSVLPELMLVSEFQNLSTERYSDFTDQKIRVPVNIWFVGAAYRLQLGGSSYGYISLLYDVIEDINSPYQNPYLGGGVIFTL